MPIVKELRRNAWLYIMALPAVVFVFIFQYFPMSAHVIAFKQFTPVKGIWNSPWVGLENIKFFVEGPDFKRVLTNTLYLNTIFIATSTAFSLFLAIALNEIRLKIWKRFLQSVVILPHFISFMVVSVMTATFFSSDNGSVNQMLGIFGVEPVSWFSTPDVWPWLLTLIHLWKGAGWGSIIYLAVITGIPEECFESARIDGATRFQQIRYITLPLLVPTVIVLTLLALGKIFYADFGLIYGIIGDNGVLFSTTDVIDTYTFRALRTLGNYSMSAAVALMQSFMGFILILFFNWIVGKYDKDYRLF